MKLKLIKISLQASTWVVILVTTLNAGSRSSANYNITDALDRGGVTASSANYENTGSAGLIGGVANNASGSVVTESGYVAQLPPAELLVPISAVSRKVHGTGGPTFDVNLPLGGSTIGVECRTGGATGDHQLILTFANPVTVDGSPQAQITSGIGQVGTAGTSNGGVVNVNGAVVTVPLTSVANAQRLTITLNNVSDGTNSNNAGISMGVLLGDTTGNGSANASDVSLTKSKSGQAVDASNFREDVTVNGSINASDVSQVKSKSGTALP